MNFAQLATLLENKEHYTIYCDLDGVLVDLKKGVEDVTGTTIPSGGMNLMRQLVRLRRNPDIDMTEFFRNLQWTPDGERLWNFIKPYNPIILTGGSDGQDVNQGKNAWVARNLGISPNDVIHDSNKQQYAKPYTILIDDLPSHAENFNRAGGLGILHTSATNTISQLSEILS